MIFSRNNRGSILLGFVIAISLAVMAGFYFQSQLIGQTIKGSYSQVLSTSINAQRITLRSLTIDSPSLIESQTHDATLNSCRTDGSFDCPSGEHDLVLYDRVGTVVIDTQDSSTSGISFLGIPCNTFDASSGNNDCPYRYKVVWIPDCPPIGICSSPSINIKGYVQYRPSGTTPSKINPANYDYMIQMP